MSVFSYLFAALVFFCPSGGHGGWDDESQQAAPVVECLSNRLKLRRSPSP